MPWSRDNLPAAVKKKKWSDAQISVFIKTANSVLEETDDDGEAIATGIDEAEGHKNSVDFPKFYYARHMRAGLAKGGGSNPEEVYKIDLDAIKKMIPTGPGKPVYIQHQDVDLDTMKDQACGYITESFLGPDGWAWFKIMVIDDEAHSNIADGWSVSNAYVPTEKATGGTMHNCDYDIEILDGEFTHLALVSNPRYEEACIMTPDEYKVYCEKQKAQLEQLKNAKERGHMFKFFKTTKKEVTNSADLTEDSYLLIHGQRVTLKDMISNMKETMKKNEKEDGSQDDAEEETEKEEKEDAERKNKKEKRNDESAKDKGEKANGDDMFDVDGEEVSLNAMKKAYKNAKKAEKKNEGLKRTKGDEEDDGDDADDVDEAEDYEKEKVNKKKEKRNSNFDDLRNANELGQTRIVVETSMDRLARGQSRYGSAK